jgi:toxin FitB
MYLLDTNIISELRAGKNHPSAAVQAWANGVRSEHCYLCAITMLELENGVQRLEYKTPPQGRALRNWLEALRGLYSGRILSFDDAAARICAALQIPKSRQERDAMIAATAKSHGLTVVTRNTNDFLNMGVPLHNPFS